jgi:hypothetical protein
MEWTGARYSDRPTVQARTRIGARPERVWPLVSDIELQLGPGRSGLSAAIDQMPDKEQKTPWRQGSLPWPGPSVSCGR